MSSSHHNTSPKKEHGTMRSYIVGFILSMIFTLIPFYIVMNGSFNSSTLRTAILVFAFIQMLVQIFFFLHLGRGPKPLYNVVFFAATCFLILVVVFGSVFIMDNLYRNMSPQDVVTRLAQDEGLEQVGGETTGACQELKENHKVVIKDGTPTPFLTEARLCDTITFINEDDQVREIAFGAHPNHDSYGGEYEVVLRSSRPKSIVLNQYGFYLYHDHLDPNMNGQFSVSVPPEDPQVQE